MAFPFSGTVFIAQAVIYLVIFSVMLTLYIVTSRSGNAGFNREQQEDGDGEGMTTSTEDEEARPIIEQEQGPGITGMIQYTH